MLILLANSDEIHKQNTGSACKNGMNVVQHVHFKLNNDIIHGPSFTQLLFGESQNAGYTFMTLTNANIISFNIQITPCWFTSKSIKFA